MLLNNLLARYKKIFPFLVELYKQFNREKPINSQTFGKEWEFLIYSEFMEILNTDFPDDGLIVEDFNTKQSANSFVWLCDPIDGTSNMSTGVSFFSAVFTLVYENIKPVLSFVLDMTQGIIYIANQEENTGFSIKEDKFFKIEKHKAMPNNEYVLIGKVFGHIQKEMVEDIKAVWWDLAIASKSYRQLGSVALQMIIDGWKRNAIVFSLEIRWFDVVASLHFLKNLGYQYQVSENRECLLVYHPAFSPNPQLEVLQKIVEKKWQFYPLNTLDVSR